MAAVCFCSTSPFKFDLPLVTVAYQLLVSSLIVSVSQTFGISECTKYRKDIPFHGADITTSNMAAFYFTLLELVLCSRVRVTDLCLKFGRKSANVNV